MSSVGVAEQLRKDNVIPDVLPEGTSLSHGLILKWPSETLDIAGRELSRQGTQAEPVVYVQPVPEDKRIDYTLIMTDPDLMSTNDTKFGQVRHWLAANLSITEAGEVKIPKDANVSAYVGPAPLPKYAPPFPDPQAFARIQ